MICSALHTRTIRIATLAILLPGVLLSGCIWMDAKNSLRDARKTLDEADLIGAGKFSPYYFTSAQQLLDGAEQEYQRADFITAIELAVKSKAQAKAAILATHEATQVER